MSTPIATASSVTRRFGDAVALQTGPFALVEGAVHGLVGRNGAGKTTLMQALAGQLMVEGDLRVFGVAPFDDRAVLNRCVLAGIDVAYPQNWPASRLLHVAALRYPGWSEGVAGRAVEAFGLDVSTRLQSLSRGQRSAVAVVIGLAARADLTLLDEPYLGLDAQNRALFYTLLLDELDEHPRTVVLSTHHLDEAAKVVDRVLVLDEGRVLADESVEHLEERIMVAGGSERAVADLRAVVAGGALDGVRECVHDSAPGLARSAFEVEPSALDRFTGAAAGLDVRVRPADLEEAVVALGAPASDERASEPGPVGSERGVR